MKWKLIPNKSLIGPSKIGNNEFKLNKEKINVPMV